VYASSFHGVVIIQKTTAYVSSFGIVLFSQFQTSFYFIQSLSLPGLIMIIFENM